MTSINLIAIIAGTACFFLSIINSQKIAYLLTTTLIISIVLILPEEIINHKIYALFGQLSITSLALLYGFIIQSTLNIKPIIKSNEKTVLCILIATTALIFYPLALGLTKFDPYSLGYDPKQLSFAIALTAIGFVSFGFLKITTIIAIALTAFNYSILISNNLWDYLIDPLLATYCVGFCLKKLVRSFLTGNKNDEII